MLLNKKETTRTTQQTTAHLNEAPQSPSLQVFQHQERLKVVPQASPPRPDELDDVGVIQLRQVGLFDFKLPFDLL